MPLSPAAEESYAQQGVNLGQGISAGWRSRRECRPAASGSLRGVGTRVDNFVILNDEQFVALPELRTRPDPDADLEPARVKPQ